MKQKKVLIISLAAGSGHIQTAKALKKTAELHFPQLNCRHIDLADYITPLLKTATVSGYGFLASHLPRVWKSLFKLTDNRRIVKAYRVLTDYLKMLNSFEFLNEVYAFNPDVIICTHFVPAEILAHTQKTTGGIAPIVLVITDYGVHPMWVINGISCYIVPTPEMKEKLIHKFLVEPNCIHTFGIPIDPRFGHVTDVPALQSTYTLPHAQPVILVLSGGNGSIEISSIVSELFSHINYPVSILAVAGSNSELFSRLKKLEPPSHITYRPFEWTDNIPEMMGMADVVVGKPGGLTTTECVASGVPLVAVNPIPGQEEYNIEFLEQCHMGSFAKKITEVVPLVTHYIKEKPITKNRARTQSGIELLKFITTK